MATEARREEQHSNMTEKYSFYWHTGVLNFKWQSSTRKCTVRPRQPTKGQNTGGVINVVNIYNSKVADMSKATKYDIRYLPFLYSKRSGTVVALPSFLSSQPQTKPLGQNEYQ